MKKLIRNIAAIAIVGVFAISAAACDRGGATPAPTPPAQPGQQPPVATPIPPPAPFSYPMDTNVTLTYWRDFPANHNGIVESMNDTQLARNLIEATGIDVEWVQPIGGTNAEGFALMVGTAQFPDIIQANWQGNFPGGVAGALYQGVMLPLNDYMAQWAPNFLGLMAEHPLINLEVMTDAGIYYVFPFLRIDPILRTSTGPMLRYDWLQEANLPVPVTIQDWENALVAFRDAHGAVFTGVSSGGNPNGLHAAFATAWGLRPTQTQGFNLRYGTQEVFWSFNDPAFRDYLETMARWYQMGLIDGGIGSRTRAEMDAMILSGEAGGFIGPVGGGLGPWLTAGQAQDPTFDAVVPRFPVLNAGDSTNFQGTSSAFDLGSWGHAAITITARQNGVIEEATRFLDFGYSEEGALLYNWGEYGLVWEWQDQAAGTRQYTQYIHNHPTRNFAQALSYHALSPINGPFPQDGQYMPEFASRPQQRNALQVWNFGHNAASTLFPAVSFTEAEADQNANLLGNINTFFQPMVLNWILGLEPLNDDTWNSYVAQLDNLGIQQVLANYQAAADRFFARGQ